MDRFPALTAETEMSAQPTLDPRQLEQAFQAFGQLSQRMESSYRDLENQVERLNQELAVARSERFNQLRERERLANRLERLLDALPGGVLVLDKWGVIRQCNPAARDLLGQELVDTAWSALAQNLAIPSDFWVGAIELADGRTLNICVNPRGREPGTILLVTAVSGARQLRQLMARNESLAAMGEMTATLVHQVRTPLAAAMLFSAQLNQPEQRQRQRANEGLVMSLRDLERQVNDMLVYARGERLQPQEVDLEQLLSRLAASLEPHIQEHEACLTAIGFLGLRWWGDGDALAGALTNLVVNALQAGALHITIAGHSEDRRRLTIAVSDDGPGIAEELREQIFAPFYSGQPGGTGLGLAVVRTVVRAHGGEIQVHPGGEGGACFLMRLPQHQISQPLSSANVAEEPHERLSEGETV